jgi:hypothetical protein
MAVYYVCTCHSTRINWSASKEKKNNIKLAVTTLKNFTVVLVTT